MTLLAHGSPHTDPWATDLIDLESLNDTATNAIIKSVNDLRERARRNGPSAPMDSLVAVGPAGLGKTHLFTRLRKKLGATAVLVHVRPLVGSEMTPRFLLGQIVQQLGYHVLDADQRAQIDLIAGGALSAGLDRSHKFPGAFLQELRELSPEERAMRVEEALSRLLSTHPDVNGTYLEMLARVPFESPIVRNALLLWLGGREPTEAQAVRIGVRDALPEVDVSAALRTIAALSARTTPLVLVFDQLENLIDANGGTGRITAYGNLVAELVDVVRDHVIVQMGLATEWDSQIERALSTSQRSRVAGKRLALSLPTPAQCEDLLRLWINRLPQREGPFPWPFTPAGLSAICSVPGTTPRMLLIELQRALAGEDPVTTKPPPVRPKAGAASSESDDDAIAGAWNERLADARKHVDEKAESGLGPEPALMIDGLLALLSFLGPVGAARANGAERIQLDGPPARSIAWVHQSNAKSLGYVLRQLSDLKGGVTALRESWRDWPPTWKTTRASWDAFRRLPTSRWHWLDREDAVRLLALTTLLKDVRSADVDGADGRPVSLDVVTRWLREKLAPQTWTVAGILAGGKTEEVDEVPPASPAADAPAPTGASHPAGTPLLSQLRVASLERIVREVTKSSATATRASIVAELRNNKHVRWVGTTIVCWAD